MKKILSLMTLLLLTVATAWAATVDDLVAVGPGYTFIAENVTTKGTVALVKDNLYDSNRIFTPTGNSVATNKQSSTFAGGTYLNCLRLKKTQDQLVFKVSEPCIVTFYTQSHSSRGIQVGSEAGGTQYGKQTVNTTTFECEIPAAGLVYLSSFDGDFFIAGFEVTATTKTVYFDNSKSNWEKVCAWAWDDNQNYTGGVWPGVELTQIEEGERAGQYSWTTTGNPKWIVFNNGSDQTADLDFVDGSTYTIDGRVVVLNDYTVTFKTDGGWSEAWAYVWTGDPATNEALGAWAGTQMTPANDEGTWTITVHAENAPENIIFHNNAGVQTPNLAFEDGKNYEYMLNDYTATFTTDAGWENVYAHVWNGTGDNAKPIFGDYPGKLLEATDGVYTLNFKAFNAESILFNNGTNETKTPDMTFTNNRAYKWITKTPLYRISENQAKITAGTTFDVTDNDEVVATITYGVSGGKDFAAASSDYNEDYAAFQYVTMGNGENGGPDEGTVYKIVPVYDGTITVGVRLNGGKPFFILEDGEAMAGYNGITVADLAKTSFSFPVKANSTYSIYCTGSKLGFYGFDYTYAKPELKFQIAGSMTDWTENMIDVYDADSYTFENLAAGNYQFKVVDGDWYGIDAMTDKAGGLYKDQDGNVCFILNEAGNVTVNYKSGEEFTAEGNFAAPEMKLIGINGWEEATDAIVLTTAEDKKSASLTMNLTEWWYDFKVIRAGEWLGKTNEGEGNYKIHSEWNFVDGLVRDGEGVKAISLQPNAVNKDYTFTYDFATGRLTVDFPTAATITAEPTAAEGVTENTDVAIINAGETSDGTFQYAVSTSNSEAPAEGWSEAIPTAQSLSAGTYYVWYKVIGDATHIDSNPAYVPVTVILLSTVTIDDGNVDAANWSATPTEQSVGQNVTLQYSGKKKIKRITIEAAAPAGKTIDLSQVTESTTAEDGDVLTGTLGANVKISIADGATVTLDGVSINADGTWTSSDYAGITCEGDATIILSGTNTVRGFTGYYPGLQAGPAGKTLTIKGTGSLTARGANVTYPGASGIGAARMVACGNIVIEGGNITATGGYSGIGGAYGYSDEEGTCGDITILGGTVTATALSYGAGIGAGRGEYGSCGNITISGGTVTAIATAKNTVAAAIGAGSQNSTCTSVTIGTGITSLTMTNGHKSATGIVSNFINATAVNANTTPITTMLSTSVTDEQVTMGMAGVGFATLYDGDAKTWTITKK